MLLGSEGTLGLITEAWVRVRPRPLFDAEVSVRFPDFSSGAAGVREIVQAALGPTQCRLLDPTEMRARSGGDTTVLRWRDSFIRGPYLRDVLVAMGVIAETFETAITWDRFEALHQSVTGATTAAMLEVCGDGVIACRFTHVYPDGPALYWTVLAPGRRGDE